MFAILRGANGRRHEVDFNQDPVIVKVAMAAAAARPGVNAELGLRLVDKQ